MTPEQVFARLRDIHTPEVTAPPAPWLDLRPLLAWAALVAAVVLIRFALRRLAARQALRRITSFATPAAQRAAILRMVRDGQAPKGTPAPPPALFHRDAALTQADAADLRRWAVRRLRG